MYRSNPNAQFLFCPSTVLCLNWVQTLTVCVCVCLCEREREQHSQQLANLINFPMQILGLLIFCADSCSHTTLFADSWGTHNTLVYRHFTGLRQNPYLFFLLLLVTIVTLYSREESRLTRHLRIKIPAAGFVIDNANKFTRKTPLKQWQVFVSRVCSRCRRVPCRVTRYFKWLNTDI